MSSPKKQFLASTPPAPSSSSLMGVDADEKAFELSVSTDPMYRTTLPPEVLSASSSSPLTQDDAPVYRGTSLPSFQQEAQRQQQQAKFLQVWDSEPQQEETAMRGKELSMPSLFSATSPPAASPSTPSPHFKDLNLPFVSLLPSLPSRPLSALPSQYDRNYSFISASAPAMLLAAFTHIFSASPSPFPYTVITSLHPHYPTIQGAFTNEHHYSVTFAVSLFSAAHATSPSSHPSSTTSIIVEVQRRSGDYYLFHQFYTLFTQRCSALGHLSSFCTSYISDLPSMMTMTPPSFNGIDEEDDDEEALDAIVSNLMQASSQSDSRETMRESLLHTTHMLERQTTITQGQQPPAILEEPLINMVNTALTSKDIQQKTLALQLLAAYLNVTRLTSSLIDAIVPIMFNQLVILAWSPSTSRFAQLVSQMLGIFAAASVLSVQSGAFLRAPQRLTVIRQKKVAWHDDMVAAGNLHTLLDALSKGK